MVKSRTNGCEAPPKVYPMLMKWDPEGEEYPKEGFIVFMWAKGKGTVVWADKGCSYKVGHKSEGWNNEFTPYTGEVTLSNE